MCSQAHQPSALLMVILIALKFTLMQFSSEMMAYPIVRGDILQVVPAGGGTEIQHQMRSRFEEFVRSLDHSNESVDLQAYKKFQQLAQESGARRSLALDETIFSRRALNERMSQDKLNTSYEGRLKKKLEINLVILYNETTIVVTRCVNKYYYWEFGQTAIALIIFLMIVVGNLSILHRLKSSRRRRSNVNYFIVQLAIADLFVGVFNVTLDSILRLQREFSYGLVACLGTKYISVLFLYSSTYLLVALSIDRWEAVVRPLAFTKNPNRGYYLVLSAWGLSFILALPVTFRTNIKVVEGYAQCYTDFDHFGWKVYMVYVTVSILIVPAVIIAICYIHIVYTIWKKSRSVAGGSSAGGRTSRRSERTIAKGDTSEESLKTIEETAATTTLAEPTRQGCAQDLNSNGLRLASASSTSSSSTMAIDTRRPAGAEKNPTIDGSSDDEREKESELEVADDDCSREEDYLSTDDEASDQSEFSEDLRAKNEQLEGGQQSAGVATQAVQMLKVKRKLSQGTNCHELKEIQTPGIVGPASELTISGSQLRANLMRKRSRQVGNQVSTRQRSGSTRKSVCGGSQQHGSGVIPKARIKTIKMTLVIVLAFILCWVPFCIINLCHVFGLLKNDTYFTTALMTLSQSLAHLNSAMNPIIFWLFSSKRNNQTNAHITTASSETRTAVRGSLVKSLAAIGGYARKVSRGHK